MSLFSISSILSVQLLVVSIGQNDASSGNHTLTAGATFIIDVVRSDSVSGSSLRCEVERQLPTNDVNKLSPFHVDVVAALGDSLTAGLAANASTIVTNFWEYKGQSWSIGGKRSLSSVTTLPNILKIFNPKLYGFSKKTKHLWTTENFNRAFSARTASDLLRQVKELIQEMNSKKSKARGVPDMWKVITIFIGSNDLCDKSLCRNTVSTSVNSYMTLLNTALRHLARNVKKAFINLVQLVDVSIMSTLRTRQPRCNYFYNIYCSCATRTNPKKAHQVYEQINEAIWRTYGLSEPLDRKDFAVVVQPLFMGIKLPPCSPVS